MLKPEGKQQMIRDVMREAAYECSEQKKHQYEMVG